MSKKFIEVTLISAKNIGNELCKALIDTDLIHSVTEIVGTGHKLDPRAKSFIIASNGKDMQTIYVAETFNEIRNRLAAALS